MWEIFWIIYNFYWFGIDECAMKGKLLLTLFDILRILSKKLMIFDQQKERNRATGNRRFTYSGIADAISTSSSFENPLNLSAFDRSTNRNAISNTNSRLFHT